MGFGFLNETPLRFVISGMCVCYCLLSVNFNFDASIHLIANVRRSCGASTARGGHVIHLITERQASFERKTADKTMS
jgi:hypothetical protein